MKKTLLLLLLFVLAWPPLLFGAGTQMEIRSLQGIDSLRVIVEVDGSDNENVQVGFNYEDYERAVELRLRSLGIRVDEGAVPYLYVNINPMRMYELPLYAVSVNLEFHQGVFIVKEDVGVWEAYATTWTSGQLMSVGADNLDYIKEGVVEQVDDFANDYLTANPPEPRSGQGGE